MPPDALALGRLRSEANESKFSADCDALAVGSDRAYCPIYLASVVGPATTVKAIAAAFNSRRTLHFSAKNCGDCTPWDQVRYYVTENAHGYRCYKTKLGYDSWHMLAISRHPNFIAAYSTDAVMQKLMSQQFTTPILKSWGAPLIQQLTDANCLRRLVCFQCDCAMLDLTNDGLDDIVSRGVSQNLFPIRKESA